jgi:cell division protein ZapE
VETTPPDRFEAASFASYRAKTPGQQKALKAARAFVERLRTPLSWTKRMRRWVGQAPEGPRGLYLVGPVGTGKTHLLAAMYHALTPEVPCAYLHSSTLFRQTDPPDVVGASLADRFEVCCLDEVEIDDAANEARLVRTLQTLEQRGVTLLATSNVEPERFLSNQFGRDRFRRFLHEEFRARYRVVVVEGEDYRRTQKQARPGHGWVGPPATARAQLRKAYRETAGSARWMTFDDLLEATTTTAHKELIRSLVQLDALYVANVEITSTDDALRLLRVIDALYTHDDAPALHFSSRCPPESWFAPDAHAGVAGAIAEKFTRTVSRLRALCEIERVG